jgi:protein-tyrosine phosphatase
MSDWFERFGFTEVGDGLLIGARPLDAGDVAQVSGAGADVVYNLCEDREYPEGTRAELENALARAGLTERRLPLVDYGRLALPAIDRAVDEVLAELEAGRRVYLHCRAGWQRSAAVAAGVVAVREGLDIEPALAVVRSRKPTADPLEHQRDDLAAWWRERSR